MRFCLKNVQGLGCSSAFPGFNPQYHKQNRSFEEKAQPQPPRVRRPKVCRSAWPPEWWHFFTLLFLVSLYQLCGLTGVTLGFVQAACAKASRRVQGRFGAGSELGRALCRLQRGSPCNCHFLPAGSKWPTIPGLSSSPRGSGVTSSWEEWERPRGICFPREPGARRCGVTSPAPERGSVLLSSTLSSRAGITHLD